MSKDRQLDLKKLRGISKKDLRESIIGDSDVDKLNIDELNIDELKRAFEKLLDVASQALKSANKGLRFDFFWKKPSGEFFWGDSKFHTIAENTFDDTAPQQYRKVRNGPFLLEKNDSKNITIHRWQPLENHALFAQFAELEPNQDEFLEWANEYGSLTGIDSWDTDYQSSINHVWPESWSFWYEEQQDLQFATMLWEMLNNKDENLKAFVRCVDGERHILFYKIRRELFENLLTKSEFKD